MRERSKIRVSPLGSSMSEKIRPKSKFLSFIFNIPPRTRSLLGVGFALAVIFIVMGSTIAPLNTARANALLAEAMNIENIAHIFGFIILGFITTLGFHVRVMIPGWIAIAFFGFSMDYFQAYGADFSELPIRLIKTGATAPFVPQMIGLLIGINIAALLRGSIVFLRAEFAEFLERRDTINFYNGHTVFNQGSPSDYLYVVRRGLVELWRKDDGDKKKIETVSPGGVFGEMGVIEEVPRYATAVTVGDCCLFRIDRKHLMEKVSGHRHPGVLVARVLAKRLRVMNQKLAEATPVKKSSEIPEIKVEVKADKK